MTGSVAVGNVARDAWLVAAKDLRLEWRTRTALTQVGPFVLAVLVLFGFALDADRPTLERATSGLFWVIVLFAAMLLIGRSSSIERDPGVADALLLSGLSPAGIFLGKVVALAVQLLVVEVVVGAGASVLYNITLVGWAVIVVTSLATTIAISAIGALYGPVAGGAQTREALLAVLILPTLAPVLLAVTRAWEIAAGRGVGDAWAWAAMLGVSATIYLAVGAAVWGSLLSEP